MKSSNSALDHVVKQKKKKDLKNNMVYSSLKGVVEMHSLGKVELAKFDNKQLQVIIEELYDKNVKLNDRFDKAKIIIKKLDKRLKIIEKGLKDYGLAN